MIFRAALRIPKSTALVFCALAAATTFAACQEQTKKRAPAVKATTAPPPNGNPTTTGVGGGGLQGGGVPGVGGEVQCVKTDAKFAAECQKLPAPDNASCQAEPIPMALCDKVKAAIATAAGGTTGGTAASGGTGGGTDPNTCTVQTKDNELRVRKSPSTTAQVIDALAKGSTFTKTASQEGWVKLKTADGKDGWACDTCNGGNFIQCGGETNLWEGPDEEHLRNADGSWG